VTVNDKIWIENTINEKIWVEE